MDPKLQKKIQENPVQKNILTLDATKKFLNRVFLIFWLVSTVFLLLRVILEGIGADPKSVFAALIYLISGIFLLPFFGILPGSQNTIQPGNPTFDSTALLAIFCYSILLLLASAVLYLVIRILKTTKQVDSTVKANKPIDPSVTDGIIY